MVNNLTIQGRITKDIELNFTNDGVPVTTFTIACDRDYKTKDGKREADFIECVAWKELAEFIKQWFHKGDMIILTGRIQARTFTARDGKPRKVTEVLCKTADFVGGIEIVESALDDTPFA